MMLLILVAVLGTSGGNWRSFLEDIFKIASLQETNTLNELKPASDEKRTLSSDDDDEHFKDIHFPPDSALQQVSLFSLLLLHLLFNFIIGHFLIFSTFVFINFPPPRTCKGGRGQSKETRRKSKETLRKILRIPKLNKSNSKSAKDNTKSDAL